MPKAVGEKTALDTFDTPTSAPRLGQDALELVLDAASARRVAKKAVRVSGMRRPRVRGRDRNDQRSETSGLAV